ncbi:unnamed protein product [Gongylonema pulchrum]|uniref:Chloride channel protein n=1 Tax=Gongylonema pulchrum TaxID=637853 RepID=A0A183EAC0_9BILA|nr:unnamed protein product [Gongylonema pulchrum]
MTISLTAILVEATRDITFGLPIMLVLMVTKWVGDFFNEVKFAEQKIMRKDVITMTPRERVSHVLEVLRATSHHGFPVVDQIDCATDGQNIPTYGHLKGLILKSQLITLIQKRVFYKDYDCQFLADGSEPLTLSHFTEEYPRYDLSLANLQISARDANCWLDLVPYMHRSPHRVPLDASLPSIFHLFRGLGLRYVIVVDDENKLRGIITRKDLARFKERRTFEKYSVRELFVSDFET